MAICFSILEYLSYWDIKVIAEIDKAIHIFTLQASW